MKAFFKYTIASLLLSIVAMSDISAQCCSAGNPVGGDGSNDALNRKQLRVSAIFRRSYSSDYYNGTTKETDQYIDRSFYNFTNGSLSYGLSKRMTAHAEFGYFFKKLQDVNLPGGKESIYSSGFGDLGLSVRRSLLYGNLSQYNKLVLSIGSRLPIGAFNEVIDGVTIPISLQPSSGAFKLNSSLFFTHKRNDNTFGWNALAYFEWSDEINKGFLVYKYGNYFMLQGGAVYTKSKNLVATFAVKYEHRENDRRENNLIINSTGSNVIYIRPQLSFKVKGDHFITAAIDLPVFKHVNGSQLTNLYAFQIGVSKNISFE